MMALISAFKYAACRNFFEIDQEFDEALQPLLVAYTEASKNAFFTARNNVLYNGIAKKSQWNEAVASTIERIIASLIDDEPVELPAIGLK